MVATVVAIVANLPSQFGGVGTDAGREFLSRGTAISAPLVPMIVLAASIVLLRRTDRWANVGVGATCLVGVLFLIGGLGEAFAKETPDTPKAVLVASGIVGP